MNASGERLPRAAGGGSSSAAFSYLGIGLAVVIAYYFMPHFGIRGAAQNVFYSAVSAAATAAVFIGLARNRPSGALPWLLLGLGQLSYTIGDVLYLAIFTIQGSSSFPTIADAFYLLQYPLLGWALVVFVRRRTPGLHIPALVDGAVIAAGVGLLWWIYLLGPLASDSGGSTLEHAVSIAYPSMDLLVLVLAVQLLVGVGARSASFLLLLGFALLMLLADVAYAVQTASDSYTDGNWVDLGWLTSYLLLGSAALHPSMRLLDARAVVAAPTIGRARLALLAGAVLLPMGLLIARYLYGTLSYLPLIVGFAALLFLLVLARMAGLVAAQRKLAIIDGLTGLYAPEFLVENLRVECLRSHQHGQELGIMLVDVDNFALLNGAYGRPAGDWALNQLATRLRTATGGYGVVGRFRDDKFLIILPYAGTQWLGAAAEQVRETISSARVPVNDGALVRLTVSIGIAVLPIDGENADQLIAVANRACTAAKRAGRNRTHGRHGSITQVAGGFSTAGLESG